MSFSKQCAEWIGCLTGLSGAALLAAHLPISGWGFALFLISNACMFLYGYLVKARGFMLMQVGFTATSILGIVTWLVQG